MYNALRGYSDIAQIKHVVPGAITDRMIGFTRSGQTRVWVNENFGMNHPANYTHDSEHEHAIDEAFLLNSLVSAITPKVDLPQDFLNNVVGTRTLSGALNWIRNNGQVPANLLEANTVSAGTLSGQNQVNVLKDTTQIQQTQPVPPVPQMCYIPQPVGVTPGYVSTQGVYQPPVGQQYYQPQYRAPQVNYSQTPVQSTFTGNSSSFQSGYQVPRYTPVESSGTNKFSFTGAQ